MLLVSPQPLAVSGGDWWSLNDGQFGARSISTASTTEGLCLPFASGLVRTAHVSIQQAPAVGSTPSPKAGWLVCSHQLPVAEQRRQGLHSVCPEGRTLENPEGVRATHACLHGLSDEGDREGKQTSQTPGGRLGPELRVLGT